MRFLTAKPVIYVANIDEESLQNGNAWLESAREIAAAEGAQLITVCAGLESELATLNDAERGEYLGSYGLAQSSLERLISECYRLLGLISYFTFNENEVRAWTISHAGPRPKRPASCIAIWSTVSSAPRSSPSPSSSSIKIATPFAQPACCRWKGVIMWCRTGT